MKTTGWWTTVEAAAYAACCRKTIVRAARTGKLRSVRLAGNRRLRFKPQWVDEWLLLAGQPDARSGVSSSGGVGKQPGNASVAAGSTSVTGPM